MAEGMLVRIVEDPIPIDEEKLKPPHAKLRQTSEAVEVDTPSSKGHSFNVAVSTGAISMVEGFLLAFIVNCPKFHLSQCARVKYIYKPEKSF